MLLSKSIRGWGLLAGLIACGLCGFSESSATPFRPSSVDRFAGHYVLSQGESEDPKQAVNRATDEMNFVTRTMARRQLRQRTVLYPQFTMQRDGENLQTSVPSAGQTLSLPVSGSAVAWRAPFGEVVQVRLQAGPELVDVFETKRGHCEHHFRLTPDGRTLTVTVSITSQDLPKPVEYRLVYRRA